MYVLYPLSSRSGLLAFSEDMSDNENDGEADGGFQTTPIHVPGSAPQYQVLREEESRDRTASNASQQIGRFEVGCKGQICSI